MIQSCGAKKDKYAENARYAKKYTKEEEMAARGRRTVKRKAATRKKEGRRTSTLKSETQDGGDIVYGQMVSNVDPFPSLVLGR